MYDEHEGLGRIHVLSPRNIDDAREDLHGDCRHEGHPDVILARMQQVYGGHAEAEEPCCSSEKCEPCEGEDAATNVREHFAESWWRQGSDPVVLT